MSAGSVGDRSGGIDAATAFCFVMVAGGPSFWLLWLTFLTWPFDSLDFRSFLRSGASSSDESMPRRSGESSGGTPTPGADVACSVFFGVELLPDDKTRR